MKKKKIRKLSLKKNAISNLENVNGGIENGITNALSGCANCPPRTKVEACLTRGGGFTCSFLSCWTN